ncbi:hypothetical protein MSP8887_02028 [Marinomonas spartinae]|uniref:hypothetical protein n=1 Tax=Marinomonas spartinae TaxID=1792290 RepID=UPI000808B222|nr:hypothetical protein [Marinomonas spartinae]SBS33837.1 hypothetical protein MSP8887_02028 [Marinomonas spartinae]
MKCPSCNTVSKNKAFKNIQKDGKRLEVQCPNCDQWLTIDPTTMKFKFAGFALILLPSLINFFIDDVHYRLILSVIALLGACLAVYGVVRTKLIPIEPSNENK